MGIEANGFASLTPRNHGLSQADQIRVAGEPL
jgi:hypothetical protein